MERRRCYLLIASGREEARAFTDWTIVSDWREVDINDALVIASYEGLRSEWRGFAGVVIVVDRIEVNTWASVFQVQGVHEGLVERAGRAAAQWRAGELLAAVVRPSAGRALVFRLDGRQGRSSLLCLSTRGGISLLRGAHQKALLLDELVHRKEMKCEVAEELTGAADIGVVVSQTRALLPEEAIGGDRELGHWVWSGSQYCAYTDGFFDSSTPERARRAGRSPGDARRNGPAADVQEGDPSTASPHNARAHRASELPPPPTEEHSGRSIALLLVLAATAALFAVLAAFILDPGRSPSDDDSLTQPEHLAPPPDTSPPELRALCDRQQGEACRELGQLYWTGDRGVLQDSAKAAEYYERACDFNDGDGCLMRARAGTYSDDAWSDVETYLNRSCEYGSADGCYELFDGVARKTGRADSTVLARACDLGSFRACHEAGVLHLNGLLGTERRSDVGAQFLQRAGDLLKAHCDDGDQSACYNIAIAELRAAFSPVLRSRALDRIREACSEGIPQACLRIGEMHRTGQLSNSSVTAAIEIFQAHCSGDQTAGCRHLGRAYMEGLGPLQRDPLYAMELLNIACSAGDAAACFEVGQMHRTGGGAVAADPEQAFEMFDRACRWKFAAGCVEAAEMIDEQPVGRWQDADEETRVERAMFLYEYACARSQMAGLAPVGCLEQSFLRDVDTLPSLARRGWETSCEDTNDTNGGAACLRLARAFRLDGIGGFERDDVRVGSYAMASCNRDFGDGCFAAAILATDGVDLPGFHGAWTELVERACALGTVDACGFLKWKAAGWRTGTERNRGNRCLAP